MDVLALGEALIEFVRIDDTTDHTINHTIESTQAANDTPGYNNTRARPLYRQGFGGDTSNAIISAARQGASTAYITAVGDDPLGKELMQLWAHENVNTDNVRQHATDPTGVYFVQPHASGRNFSYARRGSAASHYKKDYLPLDAIANAKILHVSALTMAISESMRDAVILACQHASKNDTLVSFDTNLRLNLWDLETARNTIEKLLPLVDIVFPSDDEAAQLCGTAGVEAAIEYFKQFGPDIIALTCGSDGARIFHNDKLSSIAPRPCEPVDSTGAGDSFAGSFLAHYLETADVQFAANCAAVTAAFTIGGYGAIDPIPTRNAVLAKI